MVEIIICKCGKIFAGCVDGYQCKEWNKDKRKYLLSGCTVAIVKSDLFRLEECICNNQEAKTQLKLNIT